MQIDYDYLSKVLKVFLASDTPTVTWKNFSEFHGGDQENKLIFHMEILADRGLVQSYLKGGGLGFALMGSGGYTISIVPWRLTADGHDFASELQKPSVLQLIGTKLKSEGLAVVTKVVTSLATQQA
ncbi:MAG TPA: hypothetical protein VHO25_01690, partial [Polyangiaceae bacterium]|nr:hypothetical protein [Polyangiaceae bacterium]